MNHCAGPGGIGKSRLAEAAAHQLQCAGHLGGGVCRVDLFSAQDPETLQAVLCSALGISSEVRIRKHSNLNLALICVSDHGDHKLMVLYCLFHFTSTARTGQGGRAEVRSDSEAEEVEQESRRATLAPVLGLL